MKLIIDERHCYAYTGGRPFDPALPCVVLVHGALDDHSVWALQSRSLAHHGCGVLAVDLPGHGRTEGPALGSIDALAKWLVALLDAAGVNRVTLVGHSMGSLIALEAAACLGDRAAALVMVGSAYPMRVAPALLEMARDEPLRAIDTVNALSHSTLAAKPSAPSPGFWLRGAARALNRRNLRAHAEAGHGNLFSIDFAACDGYRGGLEAAARITCPVSFVVGSADQMTPASAARELAAELRADTVVLPAGHALMGEAPDRLLEAIRRRVPASWNVACL